MNRFQMGVFTVLIAASLTVSLVIQRRGQTRGRQQNESSEQQAEQLTQLSAENERLSNLIAQMKSSQPLSRGQFTELLRLRNEAGQLRNSGPVKTQLQTTNAQLRAIEAKRERQLAEAQATPNYWSKDQLAYSGYADPESAMKSMLAAANSGNPGSWRQSTTPEAISHFEQQWKKRGLTEKQQDEEIKAMTDMLFSSSSGFHIIDQQMTTPDEAVINLSFDGEGAERKFVLKRIGSEWKFHKMFLAGEPQAEK